MKKSYMILGGIALVVILIIMSIIGTYNSLIREKVDIETQQGQIETQLQRRFDLVPNLVASVKGAMSQEQKVFADIDKARTQYAGAPSGTPEKIQAANQYESALGRLLVVMENYPQLKSIDTVQNLMTQLEGTENRISVARQRYNESVQQYDQHIQTFPTNVIAGMFNLKPYSMFESLPQAEQAPQVNFGQ